MKLKDHLKTEQLKQLGKMSNNKKRKSNQKKKKYTGLTSWVWTGIDIVVVVVELSGGNNVQTFLVVVKFVKTRSD
ncbi:hypothetical protein 7F23_55 [uncultured Caudovirales phage]|uniref:Uncharacterized protein n=1 Tax=uncultured Caudovirales phage TaxID=2100421 RepID=A0A2H4JA31_9CAUD|nr:hypothetical protein 7F23_55 [uncultured Caudovirales phage]